MHAGIPEQGCGNERAELVTGRLLASSISATGLHDDTSISDEDDSDPHFRIYPENQIQPAECDPQDTEDGRPCIGALRQESSPGCTRSKDLTLPANLGCRISVIPSLQMQEILSQVSCTTRQLIAKYCEFRQFLGNNVRHSHIAWAQLKAENQHPLLKVAGLAFGVISTPETASYREDQWDHLKELLCPSSPDSIMAHVMKDYALAWAYRPHDLPKAFNIVKAFYDEMENGDSTNFFLAPCYTVTIGQWIYDANYRNLSFAVIESVEYYADKALRQFRSLTDEWAQIDLFGMRLNALLLLLHVKEFYAANCCSTERFERKIECLLEELQQCESHPQITIYDRAGFHSVRKIFFEVNDAEFSYSAAISARLFRNNGRMQRALEEARLSGNAELVREMLQEAQDVPFD